MNRMDEKKVEESMENSSPQSKRPRLQEQQAGDGQSTSSSTSPSQEGRHFEALSSVEQQKKDARMESLEKSNRISQINQDLEETYEKVYALFQERQALDHRLTDLKWELVRLERVEVACYSDLSGDLKHHILSYLDIRTLLRKQAVCPEMREDVVAFLERKKKKGAGVFRSNKELQKAVEKFCKLGRNSSEKDLEEVAINYGFPIGRWNVSRVRTFRRTFLKQSKFNENLGEWDVTRAVSMESMFEKCRSFTGMGLEKWKTSSLKNMRQTFLGAYHFRADLSDWQTENVEVMTAAFFEAHRFNSDLSKWKVAKVKCMIGMFAFARSFRQDLSSWEVQESTKLRSVFSYTGVTDGQALASWMSWKKRNQLETQDHEESFRRQGLFEYIDEHSDDIVRA